MFVFSGNFFIRKCTIDSYSSLQWKDTRDSNPPVLARNLPFSAIISGLPFSLNILPVFKTSLLTSLCSTILWRFSGVSQPFLPLWDQSNRTCDNFGHRNKLDYFDFVQGLRSFVVSKCLRHTQLKIFHGGARGSRLHCSWEQLCRSLNLPFTRHA